MTIFHNYFSKITYIGETFPNASVNVLVSFTTIEEFIYIFSVLIIHKTLSHYIDNLFGELLAAN
jgi:hypothetical protein